MRYVLERKKSKLNRKVKKYLENEKKENINDVSGVIRFKKNCELSKEKLHF